MTKGLTEDEARIALKERQTTFSPEKCIEKYGKIEGIKRWKERQIKWQNMLNSKPEEEIKRINMSKSSGKNNMAKNGYCLLYYIHFYNNEDNFSVWKIGITGKSVEERFNLKLLKIHHNLNYEIKFIQKYNSIDEAYSKEQYILNAFNEDRVYTNYNGFQQQKLLIKMFWKDIMKLTYRQIHKLLDKGVEMFVDSPTGKKKILNKFSKMSEGYIIKYDDNTETNCAVAHNMIFNGILKGASEIQVGDIDDLSHKKVISKTKIPEQEYLDFEISDPNGLYIQNGIIHHNSGKSLIISMILEYFRRKGLKGVLIVPNINLLTQFKSDIESYGLNDLYNEIQVHGDGNKSNFDTVLTISTWQSLVDEKRTNFDFIICDECHRFASDVTSDIIQRCTDTPIRLGFTGTLPENPVDKMTLLGLFGEPKTIITSKELIERGLGCPVSIKSIILNYDNVSKAEFRECTDYQKQLQYIIDHQRRNEIIVRLCTRLSLKNQNSLVLFQRTNHGKQLFIDIMKTLYPEVNVENKDIVGKKSLEFQKQYNVFFLNGEQDSKTREEVRHILEDIPNAILLSNFALLSTGVSIRALKNLILASPMKAFTTVSQSLGRLMRLHKDKKEAFVYDIVDNFGFRKPSGIFWKQYQHRIESSYNPEDFGITETTINL